MDAICRFGVEATLVANEFIDRYMADANGEYVKVYLYLSLIHIQMCIRDRSYDVNQPELDDFIAHGGKMILFTSWNDMSISPWQIISPVSYTHLVWTNIALVQMQAERL